MWKNSLIDLGELEQNKNVKFSFEKTSGTSPIKIIRASCGCTSVKFDEKTNLLNGIFKTGSIPKHLLKKGSYSTIKTVTVFYKDGNFNILKLKAVIKK